MLDQAKPRAFVAGPSLLPSQDVPVHLPAALARTAQAHPDNGIILLKAGQEDFLSYQLLYDAARSYARQLVKAAPQGGYCVLQFADAKAYFIALWGAILAGRTAITVAPLTDSRADSVLAQKLDGVLRCIPQAPILADAIAASRVTASQQAAQSGANAVLVLTPDADADADIALPDIDAGATAFCQLSSGSTGIPKMIPQTHAAIMAHVQAAVQRFGYGAEDTTLNWLSMDHVVPKLMFHMKDVVCGSNQVQMATPDVLADPMAWARAMDLYRVTYSWAPNFGLRLLADAMAQTGQRKLNLSALKHIFNAGEQVTHEVMQATIDAGASHQLMKSAACAAYGMAETCTAVVYQPYAFIGKAARSRTIGGVSHVENGGPVAGVEIRVVDDLDLLLAEGEIGRVQIRGPIVTKGYANNDAATAKAQREDNWFDTGDNGYLLHGSLTLTGRDAEKIILNGANLSAVYIEEIAQTVPGVKPTCVGACGVRGKGAVSDALAIFFVPTVWDERDAIASNIRKAIAEAMRVKASHVIALKDQAFPKTTSGKIQRKALQMELNAKLQGHTTATNGLGAVVWQPTVANLRREAPMVLIDPDGTFDAASDPANVYRIGVNGDLAAAVLSTRAGVLSRVFTGTGGAAASQTLADALAPVLAFLLAAKEAAQTGLRTVQVIITAPELDGSAYPFAEAARALLMSFCQEVEGLEHSFVLLDWGLTADDHWSVLSADLSGQIAHCTAQGWLTPKVAPVRDVTPPASELDGLTIVPGGLGGVGTIAARSLVQAGAQQVVILGRRDARPEDVAAMFEDVPGYRPGRVSYLSCDITDLAHLRDRVTEAERQSGLSLKRVFQFAGAAAFARVEDLSRGDLYAAMHTRLDGALNLVAVLRGRADATLVMASSVNAHFGGAFAGAYSAACAASAAAVLAAADAAGLRVNVLSLSQLPGVGVNATSRSSGVAIAKGYANVDAEVLADVVLRVTQAGPRDVLCCLNQNCAAIDPAHLGEFPSAATPEAAARPVTAPAPVTVAVAEPAETAEPIGLILDIWKSVLNISDAAPDDEFFEQGGDSLAAARLFAEVAKSTGVELPFSLLFEELTPSVLVAKVAEFSGASASLYCASRD